MKKLNIGVMIMALLISSLIPLSNVDAASSATVSLSGPNGVSTGETFTVNVAVSASTGGGNLMSAGGVITTDNSSCIEIVNVEMLVAGMANGTKYAYSDISGTNKATNLVKITLKAGSAACSTTINSTETKIAFTDSTMTTVGTVSKTINVSVPVPKSTDATLKNLVPDKGTLSPTFASATVSYTLDVPEGTSKVNFTATVNDAKASIQSGASCTLTGVTTDCKIVVKAESGATKTYTVKVTRPRTPGSDATLKNLVPDTGTLSPTFSSGTTSYTLDVPEGTTKVNFTPTVNDGNAKVESGASCDLTGGATDCEIVVKAEDGSTKTYTIKVKKPVTLPPVITADATLKSLDVSGYTLSPSFKSSVTNYSMTVGNKVTGLNFDAIANDPDAKVEIVGNNDWDEGVNAVIITVTATDGTKKVYTVNVTRKSATPVKEDKKTLSSDNYLQNLVTSDGSLSPSFNKNQSNYQITVPRGTTNLKIDATPNNSGAKVKIEGNNNLKIGLNTVLVTVTAEDGSKRTYSIDVYRSEQDGDNQLSDLTVDGYTISPIFNPNTMEYEVNVGNVDEINVKALAQNPNATVEIIGNKSLKDGRNLVQVKVTDENGFTKTYFLYVNKESKKTFLGLTLGQGLALLGGVTLVGTLGATLFTLFRKPSIKEVKTVGQQVPIIEFKPEFNFGSKNGTDDDVVNEGGVLNQYSLTGSESKALGAPKNIQPTFDDAKEIPYDPYDDVVTKDELYDAIEEAHKSKDTSKLQMLVEQEALNRRKAELRAQEEANRGK